MSHWKSGCGICLVIISSSRLCCSCLLVMQNRIANSWLGLWLYFVLQFRLRLLPTHSLLLNKSKLMLESESSLNCVVLAASSVTLAEPI